MIVKSLAIVAGFAVLASGAQAGSFDVVAPQATVAYSAPATDWSGAYAGVFGGVGSGNYLNGVSEEGDEGVDIEMGGAIFGAKAGYNFQAGNLVYGVEADIGTGPTGLTPQGAVGPFWGCSSGDCYANIDLLASVRGRVGFAAGSDILIYGTAGWGFAQVTGGIANSVQEGGGSASGLVYGGGIEYAIGAKGSFGAEYLMYDISPIPFGEGRGATEVFDGIGGFSVIRAFYNYSF